jgi:predicted dehydrogenase
MSTNADGRNQLSRRTLLKGVASTAAFTFIPSSVLGRNGQTPPSDTVNVAAIGAGGQAAVDIKQCARDGGRIVALCDVDDRRAEMFKVYDQVNKYRDFRKMLDKEAKNIDAVIIAIPDHSHAVATMAAMERGKHVYCEKPLAHSISEIRALMQAAHKYNVATQLGNHAHSNQQMRLICEWIWDGAIGDVKEVYAFVDRKNSCIADLPKMTETHEIPPELDWDLWLGPAAVRPYNPMYVPGRWRNWSQFGTGGAGDWMCHVVDPTFLALKLKYPESVEAVFVDGYDPVQHKETFPPELHVRFEFSAREKMPPVTLNWYGGRAPERPPEMGERKWSYAGALIIGDKGKMVHDSHGAAGLRIIPEEQMQAYKRPEPTLPRSPGHMIEWLQACKGGKPAESNFDYGGPLSELAMLANISLMFPGRKLQWDPVNAKFPNCPEANAYIKTPYRQGWSL